MIAWSDLAYLDRLGSGAFGDVALMEWRPRGLEVAVKCNGTDCVDAAAIDNERRLYEKLLSSPHENIVSVHGVCTDAPDGKLRLVMQFCRHGSLGDYLRKEVRPKVSA